MTTKKTIERLSFYRRLLAELRAKGEKYVFSHDLAAKTGVTASQVRRDMMAIGSSGNSSRGYFIADLLDAIGRTLDPDAPQYAALVGVGNLGRAIVAFFRGRKPNIRIKAAFDKDPDLYGRVIHGCRCYPVDDLHRVIQEKDIELGVIAIPATDAQKVAEQMVAAGVTGVLNFAPTHLSVEKGIYVENIDLTMSLEKVAYFTRQQRGRSKHANKGRIAT